MGQPPRGSDNVIHVAFGRPAGRPSRPVPREAAPGADAGAPRPAPTGAPPTAALPPAPDPVSALYTRADVERIFGLEAGRLRAWERAGVAKPSARDPERGEGEVRYSFQDLLAVRTVKELVDRGVSLARIARTVDALRRALPGRASLSDVRISSDGQTIAVRKDDATFDPLTGQMLLDFSAGSVREDVVRSMPPRPPPPAPERTAREGRGAYDYYLEGCRLDGDDATRDRAEAAYRRAIEIDPALASAYTNLGTLRLLAGDRAEAERLFRRAASLDPTQAEAPYNLGFLALDSRRHSEAIALLTRATELDPDFADAHFNLAVALEEAGRDIDALPHWAAYLELEPDGPFAAAARERVPDDG